MRMVFKCAFALWLVSFCAVAEPRFPIPSKSRQAVVVLSSSWDDPSARMWRFQRKSAGDPWIPVGAVVKVNLGRTGLAWGESALISDEDPTSTKGPRKKEGDGKSPAGLFPLLKAFGHPKAPAGYKPDNLPFMLVKDQQCVDDGKSRYYNQVVEPAKVGGVTWDSAEKMKIDLYQMGLVVGHNCPAAKPGMGSCIFFHLRRGPNDPTSGCTSMDKGPLTNLLLWLKKDADPVVLQLPEAEFLKRHDASWPLTR